MSDDLVAPRLLVGLDLIEIERVERALERHPERFRARCFTAREIEELDRKPRPGESYAGRFAAKEAIGKALGHRRAVTTERYSHLGDDPVRHAVETMDLARAR